MQPLIQRLAAAHHAHGHARIGARHIAHGAGQLHLAGQVRLAEHDQVRQRDLLGRLGLHHQLFAHVLRIDHGDRAVIRVALGQERIVAQREHDRGGPGQAGRLQQHPLERLDAAAHHQHEQVAQRIDQAAAGGAAYASALQQHDTVIDIAYQMVVHAYVAELVDDDHRLGVLGLLHQTIEQRRLAAAQESGQHRHADAAVLLERIHRFPMRGPARAIAAPKRPRRPRHGRRPRAAHTY
ncbi:Uncharacterised protein [Bordetella pertussis]|nr:Uncharacterised protein [Bordetella pertussis]CFL98773.1 Uncharacterised protein [Bordetella pertussis]CFM41954.1 Uncharacterised protein [Bordetella pertussis]CFM68472.1 Uncharacterised protein [Bordetella pertussis]CFM98227.1 Uncharacterised protein [Bordetella pertussis]